MDSFTLNSNLLDWEWSSCPETLALFIHLLFRASTEERRWRGITIPKGGFITTLDELAERSGLTYKQVRTSLKRLVSSGDIALKVTNRYTLVTICVFANYDCENSDEGRQRTDRGQTEGRQKADTTDCGAESCKDEIEEEGRQRADNSENCDSPLVSNNNNINILDLEIENKKKERVSKDTPKKEQQETEIAAVSKPPSPAAKSPPYTLDFVSEELLPDFQEFLDMRKKIRKPLKTQVGVKARYNRLMTLSDGDTELAREIIRQSIEKEWQDFYQLKTQDNNGKNNISVNLRSEEDFSNRHYDTTLPDWTPSGGDSGIDEELLP